MKRVGICTSADLVGRQSWASTHARVTTQCKAIKAELPVGCRQGYGNFSREALASMKHFRLRWEDQAMIPKLCFLLTALPS